MTKPVSIVRKCITIPYKKAIYIKRLQNMTGKEASEAYDIKRDYSIEQIVQLDDHAKMAITLTVDSYDEKPKICAYLYIDDVLACKSDLSPDFFTTWCLPAKTENGRTDYVVILESEMLPKEASTELHDIQEENSTTPIANNVNHPSHYQGKHECIDEMIAMFGVEAVKSFCRCNVYKYRYRADKKNGQEDLDKADWYMDKLMELEKTSNE